MSLPTAEEVVSNYLYGTPTPPQNFANQNIQRSNDASSTIEVNLTEFMDPDTGPGRFALGSEFEIVQYFFGSQDVILAMIENGDLDAYKDPNTGDVHLSKAQFAEIVGLDYYGLQVANRQVSDANDDYAERTFIWGGVEYQLSDDVEFIISENGQFEIANFTIIPRQNDNFDFEGSDIVTNLGNNALEHGIDPSGIGRRVDLVFVGDPLPATTYTFSNYQSDLSTSNGWIDPGLSALVSAMDGIVGDLFVNGITATLDDGRAVIYGEAEGTVILDGTDIAGRYDISSGSSSTGFGAIEHYLDDYVANGITYIMSSGDDIVQGTGSSDVVVAGGWN